jgi:hypothetical protein
MVSDAGEGHKRDGAAGNCDEGRDSAGDTERSFGRDINFPAPDPGGRSRPLVQEGDEGGYPAASYSVDAESNSGASRVDSRHGGAQPVSVHGITPKLIQGDGVRRQWRGSPGRAWPGCLAKPAYTRSSMVTKGAKIIRPITQPLRKRG